MSISLLVAFTFSACNKDIPKDIPDWLKTKIIELNREARKEKMKFGEVQYRKTIIEKKNSSGIIIYAYNPDIDNTRSIIYDVDGNELCLFSLAEGPACDYFADDIWLQNFLLTRNIWKNF